MTDSAGAPTYTKIPNVILDAMPKLGNAELRVLLAIARKTIGWQKECDVISSRQIETMTGLGHRHVLTALVSIEEKGWIKKTPAKRRGFCYQLVPLGDQFPKVTSSPRVPDLVPLGDQSEQKPVPLGDQQKKEYKEKKERDRAPKKEPKERPERQANLNGFSESVAVYRQLTGKKTVAPALATMIADTVIDIPHWTAVVTAWCGAGFRPDNVSGMLDWYLHPDKMGKHASKHDPPASRPTPQPTRPSMPDNVLPPEVVAAKMQAKLNALRNGTKDDTP